MPGPSQCNKILDPVERKKCLQYKGKYAKVNPVKGRGRANRPKPPVSGGGY